MSFLHPGDASMREQRQRRERFRALDPGIRCRPVVWRILRPRQAGEAMRRPAETFIEPRKGTTAARGLEVPGWLNAILGRLISVRDVA